MQYLRQSTAGQIVTFGPYLDSTDGDTEENGLTITNTDIKINKNSSTTLVNKNSGGATSISNGVYHLTLDATDTDTLGRMDIYIHVAGALATKKEFQVMPAVIYDAFVLGTDNLPANIIAVSGDTVAADNLESQYDGTGLTGDNFPSSQQQVGLLSTGSSAISVQSESYALTTGTQSSGTFADTATVDSVHHVHTDTGGALDLYYQFDIGGTGVAASITIDGRINGANDSLDAVYAYDWDGASWDVIGPFDGKSGSTDDQYQYDLLIRHTGTGANLGKVRIRFAAAGGLTSATLYIDRIITSYAVVSQSVGYADGAVWVDTLNGTAGTTAYVNGVADNPVSTWADALTIAAAIGVSRFRIVNGSTISLTSDSSNLSINGENFSIALGGQNISGISISGSNSVSGVGVNGGAKPRFNDCLMGNVTIPPSEFIRCCLTGNLVASGAGDYFLVRCHSLVAGSGTPVFDFGASVGDTALSVRGYSGGLQINNKDANGTDTMSMEGDGQLIVAGSSSGAISLRGDFKVTNTGGATITYDDNTQRSIDILADTDELQANQGDWTTATGFSTFDPSSDPVANVTLVDTVTTNTDMRGTDNALLAASYTTPPSASAISSAVWSETTRVLTAGTNISLAKGTGVTGFNDISAAQVNAEMLDVLVTDTFAEVSVPNATASIKDMIHYTFSRVKNKTTQTATTLTVRNDADNGNLATATVSDNGTTFTKGKET